MKKEDLIKLAQEMGMTVSERMPFEKVDLVFNVLMDAFHNFSDDDLEDEEHDEEESCGHELDPRFMSLWTLFLSSAGWDEDSYFAECDKHVPTCPDCGEKCTLKLSDDEDDELNEIDNVSDLFHHNRSNSNSKPN